VVVVSRWVPWAAARLWRTTKSRLGATSTRSRFQVCVWRRPVSDGHDRLSVACLHHAVSRVHGTYLPSSLRGSRSSDMAKIDRPSILWGERHETLDGVAVAVHQMVAACASQEGRQVRRKHAGVQGCRCEQVGSRRMDGGGGCCERACWWLGQDLSSEDPPLSPTLGCWSYEGIAILEIERPLEMLP
jgi:hypothetical protein